MCERSTSETATVTVVGIGADGWDGLAPHSRRAVDSAEVLLGSTRQLQLVPDSGAERVTWPSPLMPALPGLLRRYAGRQLCVLASGDPMFFGIGSTLARLVEPHRLRVLPHPSSLSLACARLGWSLSEVEVVSLVARPVQLLHPAVQPERRILVLSPNGETPAQVAALLRERGYGASALTVLAELGGPDEDIHHGTAANWDTHVASAPLHVLAVHCRAEPDASRRPRLPGLPNDAFAHDGQLTKRDVRAATLARLAPAPGELLWDVGAGAGSVGIEWMRTDPACRAVAVENRADRVERATENASALGTPGLRVVHGSAPDALEELDTPDAVFVGGGVTEPGVLERCWTALPSGGRLVVNAVTMESEVRVADWYGRYGGELTRIAVQTASPVGQFTGWRPAMPVTVWAVTKP